MVQMKESVANNQPPAKHLQLAGFTMVEFHPISSAKLFSLSFKRVSGKYKQDFEKANISKIDNPQRREYCLLMVIANVRPPRLRKLNLRNKRTLALSIKVFLFILVVSSALIAPNTARAKIDSTTIRVPQDYSTIQEAINQANPGDTITVSSGTYH